MSKASKLITKLQPKEVIYTEGESGQEMYVIQAGKVQLTRKTGNEVSDVGTLGKGDFFGEMTLLEGHPRTETATAVDDAEVLRVNGLVFNKMVTSNGEIAVRMIRKISARLKDANDRIATLLTESSYSKSGDVPLQPAAAPPPSAPAIPTAKLIVKKSRRPYPIRTALTLIGRHDPVTGVHPEIDLSSEEMGKSVSRRHAKIQFRDGHFYLCEEIGTLNNTTVNGSKLETGVDTPLLEGDEICLGAVKLIFTLQA
ncbi:MAG: cyclic nucleotide-binding domain-containing protein [Acidobacteriota bacterium]